MTTHEFIAPVVINVRIFSDHRPRPYSSYHTSPTYIAHTFVSMVSFHCFPSHQSHTSRAIAASFRKLLHPFIPYRLNIPFSRLGRSRLIKSERNV